MLSCVETALVPGESSVGCLRRSLEGDHPGWLNGFARSIPMMVTSSMWMPPPQMVDSVASVPSWHIAMPPGGGVHSIGSVLNHAREDRHAQAVAGLSGRRVAFVSAGPRGPGPLSARSRDRRRQQHRLSQTLRRHQRAGRRAGVAVRDGGELPVRRLCRVGEPDRRVGPPSDVPAGSFVRRCARASNTMEETFRRLPVRA